MAHLMKQALLPKCACFVPAFAQSHKPSSGKRCIEHTYRASKQRRLGDSCMPYAQRRQILQSTVLLLTGFAAESHAAEPPRLSETAAQIEEAAYQAYANQDFQETVNKLTSIINEDARNPRWLEMRAQVLIDGKNFEQAVKDFDAALELCTDQDPSTRARLLAGRALAYEGLADWKGALADYNIAMQLAAKAGQSVDPYVLNSRGNCYNSLGQWAEAREDYLASSELFQRAKGFRGRNGSTTQRLDGQIFAASNAALMLVQLGDTPGAIKEMTRISRRAPGSADMRAALAALLWDQGSEGPAESQWEYACDKISVGCSKYQDADWLRRIRRWPPVMVAKMQAFLSLNSAKLGRSSSVATPA